MTALFLIFSYKAYRGSLTVRQWQIVFVAAAVGVWSICWLATVKIGTVSGFWLVRIRSGAHSEFAPACESN